MRDGEIETRPERERLGVLEQHPGVVGIDRDESSAVVLEGPGRSTDHVDYRRGSRVHIQGLLRFDDVTRWRWSP